MDATQTFPLDWNEWRAQWNQWRAMNNLQTARTHPFRGKNFLADAVLGRFTVNGRTVELSEVTMPNLSERDGRGNLIREEYRYVGLTFADGETDLVRTFEQLALALGYVHPSRITVSGPHNGTGIRD